MFPTGTSHAVPMAASEIKAFWGLTHPLMTSLHLWGRNKEDWKKKGARDAQSSRFSCIFTSTKCPISAANLPRLIYICGFGAVWIQTAEPVTVRAAKRQHQPWISFPHHLVFFFPPPHSFSHISPDSWIAVRGLPFAIWGCGTHLGNSC